MDDPKQIALRHGRWRVRARQTCRSVQVADNSTLTSNERKPHHLPSVQVMSRSECALMNAWRFQTSTENIKAAFRKRKRRKEDTATVFEVSNPASSGREGERGRKASNSLNCGFA